MTQRRDECPRPARRKRKPIEAVPGNKRRAAERLTSIFTGRISDDGFDAKVGFSSIVASVPLHHSCRRTADPIKSGDPVAYIKIRANVHKLTNKRITKACTQKNLLIRDL
jgi:hypothetical protein